MQSNEITDINMDENIGFMLKGLKFWLNENVNFQLFSAPKASLIFCKIFTCVLRSCEQPVLDTACVCYICHLDGWYVVIDIIVIFILIIMIIIRYASPHMSLIDRPPETNSLMECSRCMRLVHPSCETDYGLEGVIR